ncbi:serine acetyltransferase [Clostridium diolis]|uniref:Serine acetyltransferase n=1 Tax=Clostridium diolis TaxID=223919 RepID=A0AAV3VXZ0_9CLOT|nr:serine acetyltransferase [Clostridium diolis]QES72335.1 serine acetyltransferase [Clostridium diolis]GEA30037.1 hypothetical protein CDIOL_09600 [Clostridium diolis]
MNKSKIVKVIHPKFYLFNYFKYRKAIKKDIVFNATFRCGDTKLPNKEKHTLEFKTVKLYRKYQVNIGNIWGHFYRWRLEKNANKTGIDFLGNPNIGEGFIIGHWGRIIINGNAKFGNEIMLTHGVTIGRDIRGKREGFPSFGNRVCIRANSTVVGKVKIGDDVLIAPNTFVNFDVPSHSIVIGNPASIHHKENATDGHLGRFGNGN